MLGRTRFGMRCGWLVLAIVATASPVCLQAQQGADVYVDEPAEESLVNTNRLLQRHADGLKYAASTEWTGYAIKRAFDGDQLTSWFSERNDVAGDDVAGDDVAGDDSLPWIEVEFPVGVSVVHVNVWGNREPSWSKGYSVTSGRLELYDAQGNLLESVEGEAEGEHFDFDFGLDAPVENVQRVRFVSTADQGGSSGERCIAIGEMEVE